MKFQLVCIAFSTLLLGHVYTIQAQPSQEECRVLVQELTENYEGECQNGLAEGSGRATGAHEYIGNWHVGFPHGQGEYRYPSGDRYVGEFQKGRRHGDGTMYYLDGTSQAGAWRDDMFYGVYVNSYEILNNPTETPFDFTLRMTNQTRIAIQFLHNGEMVHPDGIELYSDKGIRFEESLLWGWESIQFPITFSVRYHMDDENTPDTKMIEFRATVSQPGDWLLTLGE